MSSSQALQWARVELGKHSKLRALGCSVVRCPQCNHRMNLPSPPSISDCLLYCSTCKNLSTYLSQPLTLNSGTTV